MSGLFKKRSVIYNKLKKELKTMRKQLKKDYSFELHAEFIAKAYATGAIEFAQDEFQETLDFSSDSIEALNRIIVSLHDSSIGIDPITIEEQVNNVCHGLGCYLSLLILKNTDKYTLAGIDSETAPGQLENDTESIDVSQEVFSHVFEEKNYNIVDFYNAAI